MNKLKTLIATCLILSVSFVASAQIRVYEGKYAVKFTDKNNSEYSLDKPEQFLSNKSIERRNKFGIALDYNDLPVSQVYVDSLRESGFVIHNVSKCLNCAVIECDSSDLEKLNNFSFLDLQWRKTVPAPREAGSNIAYKRGKLSKSEINSDTTLHYGESANQIMQINCQSLHNLGYTGKNMTIAVLDAGFHKVDRLPVFQKMISDKRILGVYDFVDNDTTVYGSDNHGMNVLSCIAADLPYQMIGTAPDCQAYLFRTEDGATENVIEEFNWAAAAEKADSLGVDLIHSSLGYSNFDDISMSYSTKDIDGQICFSTIAADIAAGRGILVNVSAGNEGFDAWRFVSAPADADSVLAIGAVDGMGEYAYFSSRGPSADNRVKPDVCAKGLRTTVQGISGKIAVSDGTSFSGPVMAGAVLCLMQAHPTAKVMEIIEAVRMSGSQYNKPDTYLGYGIPDFAIAHKILLAKGL